MARRVAKSESAHTIPLRVARLVGVQCRQCARHDSCVNRPSHSTWSIVEGGRSHWSIGNPDVRERVRRDLGDEGLSRLISLLNHAPNPYRLADPAVKVALVHRLHVSDAIIPRDLDGEPLRTRIPSVEIEIGRLSGPVTPVNRSEKGPSQGALSPSR